MEDKVLERSIDLIECYLFGLEYKKPVKAMGLSQSYNVAIGSSGLVGSGFSGGTGTVSSSSNPSVSYFSDDDTTNTIYLNGEKITLQEVKRFKQKYNFVFSDIHLTLIKYSDQEVKLKVSTGNFNNGFVISTTEDNKMTYVFNGVIIKKLFHKVHTKLNGMEADFLSKTENYLTRMDGFEQFQRDKKIKTVTDD